MTPKHKPEHISKSIHSLEGPTGGEALAESQMQWLASVANNLSAEVNQSKASKQSQLVKTGTEAGEDVG